MERYLAHLPLSLRVPFFYSLNQLCALFLLFPATRIISFSQLHSMNQRSWRMLFSLIENPVLDLSNCLSDVHLSEAGSELFKLGKLRQAQQCYQRALQLKPDNPTHIHNNGVLLYELGEYNGALEMLERLIKAGDNEVKTLSRYAQCLAQVAHCVVLSLSLSDDLLF